MKATIPKLKVIVSSMLLSFVMLNTFNCDPVEFVIFK